MDQGAKKKTYEAVPEVPEPLKDRYQTMLEVLSGEITVSEGARRLKLSRNHFQTVLHRGLKGLLEGLTPGEPGRPPRPEREVELERENDRLKRANEKLQERVETVDRLLAATSGYIRGEVRVEKLSPPPAPKKAKSEDPGGGGSESGQNGPGGGEDGGPGVMPGPGESAHPMESPSSAIPEGHTQASQPVGIVVVPGGDPKGHVAMLVRTTKGLMGVEALRRASPGVSRREAAAVKEETLRAMERERRSDAERVTVTMPGVVRGFDAMYVATQEGMRWSLVAADAAIPYRTSAIVVEKYDGARVTQALATDFERNGAPLVMRLDRWKAHETPEVRAVFDAYGVLTLHGPPHHPGYYGQLERQNRDHRAWLDAVGLVGAADLSAEWIEMLRVLNSVWLRRTLGWRTPAEVWRERPPIDVDRREFKWEVEDRAARIRRQAGYHGTPADAAERFAIEAALIKRGFLALEKGGWC